MIIATAGHIDHGKTALVRVLTGIDTDSLPEEKKRGMSIDLGFAYRPLKSGRVLGFVDVPGHERFIRNMLAGVTGIDYAILVVAADDGPMPQTEEHLSILNLLNISDGIVVLTKIDRVDEVRIEQVLVEIENMILGSCLEGAEIFSVSALDNIGITQLSDHLEAMADLVEEKSSDGYFRLAIDRIFSVQGTGLVVTGSVFAGEVAVNDELTISPLGYEVRVRGIYSQNQKSIRGLAGQRCALNIAGADLKKIDIRRGCWLVSSQIHNPVSRFDALAKVLTSEKKPLQHWTPVHVHAGTAEVLGRVAILEGKEIQPSSQGMVQIVLDRKINVLKNDGFILRDQNARRTIGGGNVIDPFPPSRGRGKPIRLNYLRAMLALTPEEALKKILKIHPSGVNFQIFMTSWNIKSENCTLLLESVPHRLVGTDNNKVIFGPEHFANIQNKILENLATWHRENPDLNSCNAHRLRAMGTERLSAPIFAHILTHLVSQDKINGSSSGYFLPGFEAALSKNDSELWALIEPILRSQYFQPPVVNELSATLEISPKVLQKILVKIAKIGKVVQVSKNRFLLPNAIFELAKIAKSLEASSSDDGFSVAEFRDRSSIGRNLAIEILEYFDSRGLTWRSNNKRVFVKTISEIFVRN